MKIVETIGALKCSTITRTTNHGDVQTFVVSGSSQVTFYVEPSRGLDISSLTYQEKSISYQAPMGVLHPKAFQNSIDGFSKNMFFGMLTTCGLENTGSACIDETGKTYSQHGSINNEEADNVSISIEGSILIIKGIVKSKFNRMHDFLMQRIITFEDDQSRLTITDEIENISETDQICLMYHYNFGSPFLSDKCILNIPYSNVTPKNDVAAARLSDILKVHHPDINQKPHVFYMTFLGETGWASIENPEIGVKVVLEFNRANLPKMDLWKNLTPDKYVLAFEPCNAFPYGRTNQVLRGEAQYLKKGEKKKYITRLTIQRNS